MPSIFNDLFRKDLRHGASPIASRRDNDIRSSRRVELDRHLANIHQSREIVDGIRSARMDDDHAGPRQRRGTVTIGEIGCISNIDHVHPLRLQVIGGAGTDVFLSGKH